MLHLPCENSFQLKGAFYEDEDSGEKWIWYVASREDNMDRPVDDEGEEEPCLGKYEAYAACESGESANIDQAPSGMSETTDLTDLCQAIFDLNRSDSRSFAFSLSYEIKRSPE